MRAIAVCETEAGTDLELIEVEVPAPGPHQALVEIKAAALNRTDLRRAQQHFNDAGARHIAGLELAGVVTQIGEEVSDLQVGDSVMAMAPNAYADYTLVDARTAIKVPEGLDWVDAASIPTWYMTAHNAMVSQGGLSKNQTVLITAATSGIGIASIQIAKLLGASKIIGTVNTKERLDDLKAMGLDEGILVPDEDVPERVKELTDGQGVDVIIDMVGRGVLGDLIESAALGASLVTVGRLAGFEDTIDLDVFALKRLRLIGVTFRTLDIPGKIAMRDAMLRDLGPALSAGDLKPLIDSTFPLEEARAAQDHMAGNRHFGKIVLTP